MNDEASWSKHIMGIDGIGAGVHRVLQDRDG